MKINTLPVRVGIIGGGQLAQMLALSARQIGVLPVILALKETDCALQVTRDSYFDDKSDSSIEDFLSHVDVVTIENEFIDLERFEKIFGDKFKEKIFPRFDTLRLIQSKLSQKNFLKRNKIPTLDFISIEKEGDIERSYAHFGGRLVLKQARLGYDGRGTFIFKGKKDLPKFGIFLEEYGKSFFGYAEPVAPFKKELSVLIARPLQGEVQAYPTIETFQKDGICLWAQAPAGITPKQNKVAQDIAQNVIKKLKPVGVFAIELFLLQDGTMVINEIAPRVHNSGHLTQNSCLTSQFEQHLRAILGLPLGSTQLLRPAAMVNIIGTEDQNLALGSAVELTEKVVKKDLWLHWYGKRGPTKGRKLGHINATGQSVKEALRRALAARKKILV